MAKTEHVSALLGGNFADNRGNSVLAFEYSERGVVHGADRPFFANIRELARPPEGIMPAGTFGTAPTIAAVNGVLAGYPGTTPIAGSGAYNGSLGVNTDGTIFTDLAAPNCVQNYKGVGHLKGVNISSDCTKVQVGLGQYFAIQVPLTKYNVMARTTYKLGDNVSAYTQFSFMESSARDETAGGSTGPGKELIVPLDNPFVVEQRRAANHPGFPAGRSGQSHGADAALGRYEALECQRQPDSDPSSTTSFRPWRV